MLSEDNLAENNEKFTKIYNLSNRKLNETEISVLLLGLKFTPTPDSNSSDDLENDVNTFFRKLRLREFFDGKDQRDISMVKNKSNFTPPCGRNELLDEYITITKRLCLNGAKESKNIKHNITLAQRNAIKSLSQDKSIVIKEADKGGGIVLMNVDFYKKKILEMLQDETYYKNIRNDDAKGTLNKIKHLLDATPGLTEKEKDFMLNFDCESSSFYGLPKIHKSEIIQTKCKEHNTEYIEVTDPEDLHFRPIVAGPHCETSRLSQVLDILLKPFLNKVQSYLRDDIDFVTFVPSTVPEQTKLVSFDVVSLYTNIPHELGAEAISFWLDKYPDLLNERFSKVFVQEGLKLVLENNNFCFNEAWFNQIKGTAMGTKVAPTYATLVLGYLEEKLYVKLQENEGTEFAQYIKNQWKRYLDDCFIFWKLSLHQFETFENALNSLHKDISFKKQESDKQMPFLDILVKKDGTYISTDIFFKQTDSKQYLNFKSCHPKHTKVNIPFSLARRICTIVSDSSLLRERLIEMASILVHRRYPIEVVKAGITKALQIPREQLLKVRKCTEVNITPFISTHNPKKTELYGILKQNINILENDDTMKRIINNTKIIKCKRQLPNLKRILTKSKFCERDCPKTVSKCNQPRCGLCDYIVEGSNLKIKNKTFHVKENMDCTVERVLYVLICKGCNEFYIGQTGDKLRNRLTVHKQQVKDPATRQLPLSAHLDVCSKSNPKFSIFPFYKFHNNDVSARLSKEQFFIQVFQPSLNSGSKTLF